MNTQTIHLMITRDLGYCCEYAFFCHYKQTALIADRLGVTRGPVKKHKARVRAGLSVCEGAANCQKRLGALRGKSPPR